MNNLTLIYCLVLVVVFYFLIIRPDRKRKKQQKEMRDNIAVGDDVTTIGGLVGKVVDVRSNYIIFETSDDRVRIQVAKWGISSVGKIVDEKDSTEVLSR